MASASKSTTVRFYRAFFRLGEAVAPRLAARAATRLWFTLPAPTARPDAPAGAAEFAVTSQGATVRGSYWGDGPVVYLVHGWGGSGAQLGAYVEPLVQRGYRVVSFDSPSHGVSDPGPSGRRSSTGVEFAKALDAVAARFGPAHAVIAHSMGAISTLLTLKCGWLATGRLVLLAPLTGFSLQLRTVQRALAIGPRTHRQVERLAHRRVGVAIEDLDLETLFADVDTVPTLVVHDRDDRQTSFSASQRLAASVPDASFIATRGLGHQRLLRDPKLTSTVVGFVDGDAVTPNAGSATMAV
ncbi:MAG TPA: alpha/beta fold hydrolase [Actinomycetales bacterium]|nr:alpha/beta fold hydrolase [Actinomycetales bacterium]